MAEKFIAPVSPDQPGEQWNEERLIDADGEPILIRYQGKPNQGRYAYIRGYLDLKIRRMKVGTQRMG